MVCNDSPASLRRCGGQGDIVAGVAGLMNLWSKREEAAERSAAMRAAIATSGSDFRDCERSGKTRV